MFESSVRQANFGLHVEIFSQGKPTWDSMFKSSVRQANFGLHVEIFRQGKPTWGSMFESSVRQANFGLHVEIFRRTSRLGGQSCVFGLLFQPLSSARPDPWRYLLLRERQGSEADRRNGGEQSDMGRGTDLGRGGRGSEGRGG